MSDPYALAHVSRLPTYTPGEQDRKVLEADPEFSGLDFGGLEDGWTGKEGIYDPANVKERARNIRKWLRSREEKEIVGSSFFHPKREMGMVLMWKG